MNSFEDIRAHCAARWTLGHNEPYLLSFDLPVESGRRRQGVFLAELQDENGRRYLRISTPVAPAEEERALQALRFNWEQRVGFLAVSDLEGIAYLHVCENRPYELLDAEELDRVVAELGGLADRLEQAITPAEADVH